MVNRLVVSLLVAAALTLTVSATAGASVSPSGSQTRTTTGAEAVCTVTDTGLFKGQARCTISDKEKDGDCVYVRTQVQQFPSVRQPNWCGGFGTSTTKLYNFSTDGAGYYQIKVCRDRNNWSDNCSSYMAFYVT